jgi:hypothetical protein
MHSKIAIPPLDLAIIVVYLVGILTVGVLATRKKRVTGSVFFLAGRSLRWWIVGVALFASNISTIHLVGFAASGYNEGLVWGNFELMSGFTLILLALVFGFCAGICKTPRFYWGWALSLSEPAAVVAVEMWEPAFGAGFQARWDGQQIFGQDAARGPTERHFHSEPGILPILMRILSLAAAQDQNVRFQKPTQNEHFYRLSCRAGFCAILFQE